MVEGWWTCKFPPNSLEEETEGSKWILSKLEETKKRGINRSKGFHSFKYT
ncbi:hypothetical protein SLEP1_g1575 [Rubroshorea leprosula]|uniref:Uncharacterized protein n=1 Tax=Rubroshorea leprosula TaxID=152421 RepID=A0AAV5HNS3_9ROSI|nr:hypothetical protein SLEP1_g1575 [Rubroshorea leprosula]